MEKDTLRMQFLSGVITEGQYKEKLKENAASIFDVVTMDGKTMVGTHQDGVGFKANKKGIEMGFEDNPKSIPNKTKIVKAKMGFEDNPKSIPNKIKIVKAKSLNESMIGGIVGIGAINQIPPRAKADYETAFEHFLGEKYGLNEVEMEEAEMPAVYSRIKNDDNFQKLVAYFKKDQNKDEAEKVEDEIKTLEEDWIKGDKGYSMQDGVDSTYVYFKDGKYYKRQSLPGGSGFGKYKTDEISKEDFQKIQTEYVKEKLMKIGLGAAAVGFVGALMAGPLGANDPGNILQAALIAAGFGGAAASIFE